VAAGWFFPSDYRNPTPRRAKTTTYRLIGAAGPAGLRHRDRARVWAARGRAGVDRHAMGETGCLNARFACLEDLCWAAVRAVLPFATRDASGCDSTRACAHYPTRLVGRYTQSVSRRVPRAGEFSMLMRFASQRRTLRHAPHRDRHPGARARPSAAGAARHICDRIQTTKKNTHTLEQRPRVRSKLTEQPTASWRWLGGRPFGCGARAAFARPRYRSSLLEPLGLQVLLGRTEAAQRVAYAPFSWTARLRLGARVLAASRPQSTGHRYG